MILNDDQITELETLAIKTGLKLAFYRANIDPLPYPANNTPQNDTWALSNGKAIWSDLIVKNDTKESLYYAIKSTIQKLAETRN